MTNNFTPAKAGQHSKRLSKEEYAEKMKAEKEAVYRMADDTAKAIVSDPEKFKAFLDTQSRLDRYSAVNALLIYKQLPEASQLKNFDDWSKDNVKIQKGAKSISILEPVEYAKRDGTTGISYNVKKVFDVSQTNGKRPPAPTVNRDPKELITTMLDSSPVNVEAADDLPYPNMAAFYNNEEQTLYVKRDVGDSVAVAQCVAQELGHAQLSINSDSYSRSDMGFQAVCIGYMLCKKYGIDTQNFAINRIPDKLANKEPKDIRYELSKTRNAMADIHSRVSDELYKKKQARSKDYCSVYGVNNWAMSTYRSKKGLMYNYIIPLIGDVKLEELTPRLMDKFYQSLLKVKTKSVQNKKPKNEYLTVHTVREIHKFLRSAFNQAVKWELMTRNPVLNATLPKEEHQKREIWTAETLMHALEVCDDDILSLAINLSFACSLRMGEMLGLTWDCVDISEESLSDNNASIYVDKELQRVNRDVMEVLENKDIIRVFPRTLSNTNTSLVLKTPKTKTSVRKIFLPSTVAQMLLERKKQTDEMKELFGDEYLDYNLVFCHSSGRPMEGQVINRALKKLIKDNDLPDIVFHSFRHASITYKLKWNGGDMKSVQGDSGHARMDMVADVYSHIIDEDRRYNAQKFEEQFYNAKGLKNVEEGKTAPMPKFETSVELLDPMAEVQETPVQEEENSADNSVEENASLIAKLLSNPETAALLKALAKTI